LPAQEIPWKLSDPTRTTNRFEGIFLKAVLTSMHSFIETIEMKGLFFEIYDKNKKLTT
jgi:hypothetical protein